jgi:hypothetical protein
MFGLFLSIALLLLAISVITAVYAVRATANEVRTPGAVTALTLRTDADGAALYYPVVTFTLPDGTRTHVQSSEGSWPAAYAVDDAVTVLYDPAAPDNARIDSAAGRLTPWIWTLVTGVLAAAFLAAATVVRWVTAAPG